MANAREENVWTLHADQEWEQSTAYEFTDENDFRQWILSTGKKQPRCLDFGCGSGLWRNLFKGCRFTGVDQNKNMIAKAKMRWPNEANKFQVAPWDKLPFKDESFDVVFTSAVLQHNSHDDKRLVMTELSRVLKKDGLYICTENTLREDNYIIALPHEPVWHPGLSDGFSFTVDGWKSFMLEYGLSLDTFTHPDNYKFIKA